MTEYWPWLNHLPQKAVNQVVNQKIINNDRECCDILLKKIYEEK